MHDQIITKHFMDINNKNELQTRVWIQDMCKKSTVLIKKYWDNTVRSINIVIDHLLCYYVISVLFCYAFMHVCLLMPCVHLLGKG